MFPFIKYMVKLTKSIEDVLGNSELMNSETKTTSHKDKRTIRNIRRDVQSQIKQHYSKVFSDKDNHIASL